MKKFPYLILVLFSLISAITPSMADPIHDAAQSGNTEELRQLIESGADIESLDEEQYTPLLRAVVSGDEATVKFLLDSGANANISATTYNDAEEEETVDALQKAITNDQPGIINLLLKHGAIIQSNHIHLAICKSTFEIFAILAKHGAPSDHGALGSAVECGNKEALTYLMGKAGKLDYAALSTFPGYFTHAAESPIRELFEQLFAGDSDFKIHAQTLVARAIQSSNANLALYLISKGVDTSKVEIEGNAVLLESAKYRNPESLKMIELLLGNNFDVDINTRTDWGNTALALTTPYGNKDIAVLLLKKGADVNTKNELFNTPLHMAAARDLKEMVNLFIKNGAKVNALNADRNTPLHQAVRFPGSFNSVKLLLDAKANVNAKNRRGMTPLHYLAIRNSSYKDFDVQPSQEGYQDPDGLAEWQRPYSEPAGDEDCMVAAQLLLDAGADPNIQNLKGETPLQLARDYSNNPELVQLLEAKAGKTKP